MNYLEELISEWYEYNGYFLMRNIMVERRKNGGYDSEIDIIAFCPREKVVKHIETSSDSRSWKKRNERFATKFELGEKKIKELFEGIEINQIIQKEVILLSNNKKHETLGGAELKLVSEYLKEIYDSLKKKKINQERVSEQFPLLRTIQLIGNYEEYVLMEQYIREKQELAEENTALKKRLKVLENQLKNKK